MRLSSWRAWIYRGLPCFGAVTILALSGCGFSSSGSVKGTVSYKGRLLKGGNVVFESAEGKRSASSRINEDGTYSFDKLPIGEVKISVETASLKPAARGTGHRSYEPPPGVTPPGGYDPAKQHPDTNGRYLPIPDTYANAATSGLTYTVKSGAQVFNIELP